jgi:hypothetical protein
LLPVRNALALVVFVALFGCSRTAAAAPTPQTVVDRLNVFVDCQFCFQDYIRGEITFVDYVREPADAHVHIIITRQSTGSGGQERAIQFIGLGPFAASIRCCAMRRRAPTPKTTSGAAS